MHNTPKTQGRDARGVGRSWAPSWSATFRRGFWLALLLLHIGAIRSAIGSLGVIAELADPSRSVLRLAALVLATAFFVLKVVDVRWLRLKPGWRPLLSSAVVAALLHVNVIGRTAHVPAAAAVAPFGAVLFITTCLDGEALRRAIVRLALPRTPCRMARSANSSHDLRWRVRDAVIVPPCLVPAPTANPPRAPPLA